MPLLIQNRGVDRFNATADLFDKYPHLQENARTFHSKPIVAVDPKCLLYVQQREFAATTPADNCVSVIGSDDATTCHLVVLRHTGSGAVCLAHCDGSSTWSEIPLLVKAVMSLSDVSQEGRLELHLVGGFNDESNTSHKLSHNILAAFQKQKEEIHLETCCITELNDVVVDETHRPIVYGISVNVKTGEVFPSSFPYKGPAEELRSARTFTGGQMADIYDSSRGLVKVGPCKWSPNLDIAFWLSQNDDTILRYLSTSPMAEPPHFVQHMKSTIRFLLEHPNPDCLFPGDQPQLYHRTETGDWERMVHS
ncbi:N-terminal asparagine amidohydrolase [Solea senegalensis]|uniref:N-terminal asparagine amidohydrolase n=1 Tax=Solea senegalensis TaxID=28829 RepID=A0AAV6Q5Z3_SOLSE|nr:protein N-terminal asparagine amidohydrolase isoform X2 [Solea senegalensis]KAG7484974.1 N-terminal asparagine amidohydrolase [Solea senegalensis]